MVRRPINLVHKLLLLYSVKLGTDWLFNHIAVVIRRISNPRNSPFCGLLIYLSYDEGKLLLRNAFAFVFPVCLQKYHPSDREHILILMN
jgi:hypothetical protein